MYRYSTYKITFVITFETIDHVKEISLLPEIIEFSDLSRNHIKN